MEKHLFKMYCNHDRVKFVSQTFPAGSQENEKDVLHVVQILVSEFFDFQLYSIRLVQDFFLILTILFRKGGVLFSCSELAVRCGSDC